MIREIALTLGVVLIAGTDWGLDLPGERDCAKSHATCETARSAIRHGWIAGVPRDALTACAPVPGCFDERSLYIPGFNGPRPR